MTPAPREDAFAGRCVEADAACHNPLRRCGRHVDTSTLVVCGGDVVHVYDTFLNRWSRECRLCRMVDGPWVDTPCLVHREVRRG